MRTFFEEWRLLEQHNSVVVTAEIPFESEIRQLQLANLKQSPPRHSHLKVRTLDML